MSIGVRLGIDVGKARVGIARSDASGLLASPVETVQRDQALDRIVSLVVSEGAKECVVGLPVALSGNETSSTADAREFAAHLASRLTVPVRLVDERLSTVSAQAQLSAGGHSSKKQRGIIDQAAAVIILQHLLDSERAQGSAPGELVTPPGSSDD